jgi:symplekin
MQVWSDDLLWQGWIKCCRSTMPHSYSVILQLPPPQLEEVLQKHPDLKEPLARYQQANPALMPRASLVLLGLAAS